jgi:hypothetical protein
MIACLSCISEPVRYSSEHGISKRQLYQVFDAVSTGLEVLKIFKKGKERRDQTVNRAQLALDRFTLLLAECTKDLAT